MIPMKEKVTSLEELAVIIQDGFSKFNGRFTQMDKQFTRIRCELKAIRAILGKDAA